MRREWLAGFVTRKTAPKGAEFLIREAIVTGHHTVSKALEHRNPMLFTLLGIDTPTGYVRAFRSVPVMARRCPVRERSTPNGDRESLRPRASRKGSTSGAVRPNPMSGLAVFYDR